MERRDCFRLLGAAGTAALLAGGCSPVQQRFATVRRTKPLPPLPKGDIAPVARLLNRAGFGPTAGDLAAIPSDAREAWLDRQLKAPAHDEDEAWQLRLRLRAVEANRHESAYELRDMKEDEVLEQLQKAALLRAAYSQWQLRERMVDFWNNHFNIYARKVLNTNATYARTHLTYFKPLDEAKVIRQHALGRFPDLLKASARSPAMLGYLDNNVNQKGVANENYARELMELHTLGVGGGYTQKDVQEVARCLTGWTVEDRPIRLGEADGAILRRRGAFRFDPKQHDDGEKVVLGTKIPAGGGEADGLRVLEILTAHPNCARFLSRKLVRYFRGDEDPAWVDRLAAIYLKTGGDIGAMLKPMLLAPDLVDAPPILKRPFDFLASAVRVTNADTDGGKGIQRYLKEMGQPLYEWPMPDGYPDTTAAWTGSLLARWNFAFALTGGSVGGTQFRLDALKREGQEAPDEAALVETVLARRADDVPEVRKALAAANGPEEQLALLLASPAFQWR
jgi:Uncharacterized protein conserved in bacteria